MKLKPYLFLLLLVLSTTVRSQNFIDLVKATEKAVFLIETFDKNNKPIATGSGFFINENGIGISNIHVFENAYSAKIKTSDNKYYSINKIIAANEQGDVLKFSINNLAKKFSYLLTDLSMPLKGEDVFVLGSPEGLESSVSKGIIAGTRNIEGYGNTIQFTASISHGNSGSPLLNMKGKVIGIVTFSITSGQNLNFAISTEIVNEFSKNSEKYKINKPIDEVEMFNKSKKYYADGVTARNEGRTDEAINYFTKFIESGGYKVMGYAQRGLTKEILKDYEGALADYDLALLVNPTDGMTVVFKIQLLLNMKEYSVGVTFLDKVLNIKPTADLYYDRGLCKERLEDYKGAVDDYTLAINLKNNFVEALTARGGVELFYLVLIEDANRDLTKAISINPNYARAYFFRGALRQGIDDINGACEDFRKSLALEYSQPTVNMINMTCH